MNSELSPFPLFPIALYTAPDNPFTPEKIKLLPPKPYRKQGKALSLPLQSAKRPQTTLPHENLTVLHLQFSEMENTIIQA